MVCLSLYLSILCIVLVYPCIGICIYIYIYIHMPVCVCVHSFLLEFASIWYTTSTSKGNKNASPKVANPQHPGKGQMSQPHWPPGMNHESLENPL